jgi:hypothetical protein
MAINQTAVSLSVPFSLLLMTLVMPYDKLNQIVSTSRLGNSSEIPVFLKAINHACFILGIVVLLALIPTLLRGPRESNK